MARKNVFISDLSGEEIPEGKGAVVTIRWTGRDSTVQLDVTNDEADELAQNGRRLARRGRRPKIEAVV